VEGSAARKVSLSGERRRASSSGSGDLRVSGAGRAEHDGPYGPRWPLQGREHLEQVRGLVPVTEGGAGVVGVAEVEEGAGEVEGPAPAILAAAGALWNVADWPCGLAGSAAPPGGGVLPILSAAVSLWNVVGSLRPVSHSWRRLASRARAAGPFLRRGCWCR
jgi:hypothetical protein